LGIAGSKVKVCPECNHQSISQNKRLFIPFAVVQAGYFQYAAVAVAMRNLLEKWRFFGKSDSKTGFWSADNKECGILVCKMLSFGPIDL
jgi:hypothetical protein